MSYLATQPQLMAAAAENLAGLQTALAEINSAVAGPTTGLAAAAADEVSEAAARLFGVFGLEYQQVVGQTAAFHAEFTRALTTASLAYAEAEIAGAAALAAASPLDALLAPLQPLLAPIQALFAPPAISGGTPVNTPLPTILPTTDVALIMTGSGTPIPSLAYMAAVRPWIQFHVTDPLSIPLNTPEGLYPLTAIKDLTLNVSVQRGVEMLHNALFSPTGLMAGPNPQSVSVLGYSQSAVLSSIELRNLVASGITYDPLNPLTFTLLGNPMAPNGGLLSRFPGLSLPALGLDFFGPTPSNTGYPLNMFSLQYDGYTQFPRYPINFLADLNAFLGIQTVHGDYPSIIGANGALAPGYSMVELPVSPGNLTDHYYVITYDGLPLVQPFRSIPVFGNAIADLIEPNLTYLVNWGYGDPHYGYSTGYADVHTPFGLIPPIPANFIGDQIVLANQGWNAFVGDIQGMVPTTLPSLTDLVPTGGGGGGGGGLPFEVPSLTGFSVNGVFDALKAANTNITTAITASAADGYAALLPTADIANSLLTTLPSYNLNLFLDGIQQALNGDPMGLVNAFGNPIAADVALFTLSGGFQLIVTIDTVTSIIDNLTGALIPTDVIS